MQKSFQQEKFLYLNNEDYAPTLGAGPYITIKDPMLNFYTGKTGLPGLKINLRKRFAIFLAATAFIASFLLPACGTKPYEHKFADTLAVFKDDLGNRVEVVPGRGRVMGLCPSMTEMLYAVCPDTMICGITEACNYPPAAMHKQRVKVFPPDLEGILRLKPSLIFTEEGMTGPENAEKLRSMGVPVYYQSYLTIPDVINGLRDIGKLTKCEARANKVADSLAAIEKVMRETGESKAKKPKVLVITWKNPIYAHGYNTIMTDKLALAGADNALDAKLGKQYPELSREYLLKLDPDIIFGGTPEDMEKNFFSIYPELRRLKAYKNKHLYALTDDLATRPGPRVLQAAAEMKKLVEQAGF
ncbi:MAG: helical backbone metal receptor [Bacteroidota bacterium]